MKITRILIALYGVVAYGFFLVAFIYAIGFVGNLFVPKSIDSGTESTLWMALWINPLLLSIFVLQHSIMARPKYKKWIRGAIGPAIERSTFVLLSSLALLFIFWQWRPVTTIVWKVENEIFAAIMTGLFFFGWLFTLLSTFMINHFELFGLKQIVDNWQGKMTEDSKFQTNFFNNIVRHPIMLGFIIAFWATPEMTVGHLIFSVITTIYIFIAVKYLEEKDLIKTLGKEYTEYQKKVPMIFPFPKKNK